MPGLADLLTFLVPHRRDEPAGGDVQNGGQPSTPRTCPTCNLPHEASDEYRRLKVCPSCRHHFNLSARDRIDALVDPRSFKEMDRNLRSTDPLSFSDKLSYRARLVDAQKRTGLTEAVVTGAAMIGGRRTVIGAMDFDFLGGSMGSVVGEKVARAFEWATRRKLPIVLVATSGGARMQEGMLSLVQMAKTAAAAKRHQAAGLPYIAVLANPTTGGIYASFASLGDIILAEPNALIGFAGPRVIEQTIGERLPADAQKSEFLLKHGQIDMVVDRARLRGTLSQLLDLTHSPYRYQVVGHGERPAVTDSTSDTAWQTVQLARHDGRPTSVDYIRRITSSFVELHGDRLYGDDPAVVGGLAELAGQPVVIVGQERGGGDTTQRNEGRARPEGYRKARRLMLLAAKLGLPLVTFIDTPGAYPGLESEERGLAGSLAVCLATMSDLPTPIISAIIGEGGSGGALALGLGDRILMQEHAIYSVIAPEGAAAILYHDSSRAQEVATALRCTARDCKALGVVDALVSEPAGGAHTDVDGAAQLLKSAIVTELVELQKSPVNKLIAQRYQKFRRMGELGAHFQIAIAKELSWLQNRRRDSHQQQTAQVT